MKKLILGFAVSILIVHAHAEEGFHSFRYAGGKNTALIHGSKYGVHQDDRPQPPRVAPGTYDARLEAAAPSDAEVLFDGGSLEKFQENEWQVRDGAIVAGKGGLSTRQAYGDCQLHVEWRAPNPPEGKASNMGNSGIFLMGRYELQVFDSYSCRIYADGSAGAIYGQTPPLVNVCRKPGEWQTYDILFSAPVFDGDKLVLPARITVLHNGVYIQVNTEIVGPTAHYQTPPYKPHQARLPILFQGHSSPVEYRNIWIRDLVGVDQK